MNNILTALDIDSNQKTIQQQIETNVIAFNKKRLKDKTKEIRDNLKLEYPDNEEKQTVSKDTLTLLAEELLNDNDTRLFRANQEILLKTEKDNYYTLRQTINDLNELNEFSSEIERNEIQKVDKFLSYQNLINFSLQKLNLYHNCVKVRRENIDNYISTYKGKQLQFNTDSLSWLLMMRDMYKIDKSIDDIDLYEKYNMENNVDVSNKLADICFQKVTNGDMSNNIINEFATSTNVVSALLKNQIISNKLLGIFLKSKSVSNKASFISNNLVTCLKTMYVNNINNQNIYCTRTIGELLFEIVNDDYQYIDKSAKQQIYSTYDGHRPSTEDYHKWNGLQVFDIDLKLWEGGNIDSLKQQMHKYLVDFNWFLWICKSASGKGIHIYTKVTPPHHVYTIPADNEYISKYWYSVNYETKLSIVHDVLYRIHKDTRTSLTFDNCLIEDFENKFVDNSVGRITSGIRLTYDANPLVNNNFLDLHVGLNLSQTIDGFDYKLTIETVLLRQTKIAKKYRDRIDNELVVTNIETLENNKPEEIDLSKFITLGLDTTEVKSLPRNSINYQLRYNVCNTLAALFGKEGLPLAHKILDSTACKNVGEINSFYSCALSNKKNPSKYGLDILKRNGIIKTIEPELKEVVDDIFKNGIKKAIINSLNNKLQPARIELSVGEYLSDKKELLANPNKGGLTNSKINIIFSPPGTGKTEYVKSLAKDGKRVMLVLPYISVIQNKIETDKEICQMFDFFYGTKNIRDMDYGINAVTTFDKFAKANYDKISKMFDYIFIDEVHLLFTSSYRIQATSNVIKKIKELYFISSNDPFAAKLCLLTGTPVGEEYFFSNVANIIRINKKSLNKTMEFIICDDGLDAITRMASKLFELLQTNHRVLIPTNKGEIYSEKIIGMVEFLLGRDIKYGYYKRSNTEQEICNLINNENSVGDYEVIFCSNYLSVGVDINDAGLKFASIYLGNFSGYEIEQFNARIRKIGITSIYLIQTEKSDGTTNDLFLEEPELLLHITQEDVENFADDKEIASAKQEFVAQYDPVLHKIETPGFSYFNGKIRFNLEEYELISFETKYNDCMQHPVKVARELDKYGYEITVSTEFDGLPMTKQEELKAIGIQASKEEKIKKHSLLVGTFIDLVQKNSFVNSSGLEFTGIIEWIGKHSDLVFENREQEEFINIEFDLFATPQKVTVRSKEALDKMYKPAHYLISKYSITKILEILNTHVDENGILKQKNFSRAINLLKLVESSNVNELTAPLMRILDKIYDFVDQFEVGSNVYISYHTYKATLDDWTHVYIDALGINIKNIYGFDKIQDMLVEMLLDIATKSQGKKGIRFQYNKLPDTDSSSVLNRRSVDSMIQTMFKLTTDISVGTKKSLINQKHIVLEQQNF